MTREEFESRMGNTVTPEAYEDIQDLYISAGDIDKDTFCDDYKLHRASKILAEIWMRYKTTRDALQVYKREHQQAAELLVRIYGDSGLKDAEAQAYKMLGQNGVIKAKLRLDIELSDGDKAYIIDKI